MELLERRYALASIAVTTVADDLTPNDGTVSLREAIAAINAGNDLGDPNITAQSPGAFGTSDAINFNIPGSSPHIIVIGSDASALGLALPTITKSVTINGGGAADTILDGNHAHRVLNISGAITVNINGLTLRNGFESSSGGGGILITSATVNLDNSIVTGNLANSSGGGIRSGGPLTITNSTISGNSSEEDQGGGIFGGSPLVITNSTISGNTATLDQGGGIFTDGPLTVTGSTISGNTTGDQGGGIFIENGAMTIINSTISGNTSADTGGGIFNNPPLGESSNLVRLINVTVTGNSAQQGRRSVYLSARNIHPAQYDRGWEYGNPGLARYRGKRIVAGPQSDPKHLRGNH